MRCRSLLFAAAALVWAAAAPTIEFKDGRFIVTNIPSETASFSVYADSKLADPPALLGSREIANGTLVFTPKYPLIQGMVYRAVLSANPPVVARFKIAETVAPRARVLAVYPTTAQIPENQLKFYLHFSAPMSRGDVYSRLHLLDRSGHEIEAPFLELDQELWDRTGMRLTLLFDPGRIKRDLVPNKDAGPPLVPGRHYTFLVDAALRDAEGSPLAAEFRKEFTVVAADRTPPSISKWKLDLPAAGTRDALIVRFGEPLDHALVERLIAIEDVSGNASIQAQETEWRFIPEAPWKAGVYSLAVDTALEDLAGNRMDRQFDVDLFEKVDRKISREITKRTFHIR